MVITINSKEYIFEFGFEASMRQDFVTEFCETMFQSFGGNNDSFERFLESVGVVPQLALKMFHVGLLEHHAGEVKNKKAAKKLLKDYMAEHKNEETGSFHGVVMLLLGCMKEDGFFKFIGLEKLQTTEEQQDEE